MDHIVRFEIFVQNTGNITLAALPLHDWYDAGCMEYVGAAPGPTWVNPFTGEIHWDDIAPLAPGDAAVINVFVRVKAACPATWNCARVWWESEGHTAADAMDCMELPISPAGHRIYLPLVRKEMSPE